MVNTPHLTEYTTHFQLRFFSSFTLHFSPDYDEMTEFDPKKDTKFDNCLVGFFLLFLPSMGNFWAGRNGEMCFFLSGGGGGRLCVRFTSFRGPRYQTPKGLCNHSQVFFFLFLFSST